MLRRKKILFIHKMQFGYLTDVYKWCQYLRDDYDITVVSLNQSHEEICMPGINVVNVSARTYLLRGILFLWNSIVQILKHKGVVFVVYFKEAYVFRLLFPFRKRMVLDIRTLSVSPQEEERRAYDERLKKCASKYQYVTVISNGVANKLNLLGANVGVIPLGASRSPVGGMNKSYLHLVYVGTLFNRRIEETIDGLAIFKQKNPNILIKYDIIGSGIYGEKELLQERINKFGIQDCVKLRGHIPHNKITPYLEQANVGVSYVPITDYYDYQPPTKTYEYILSGLLCLATATKSNEDIINEDNGCLVEDNAESFAKGLEVLMGRIETINRENIKDSLSGAEWSEIVNKKLKPIIENVYEGRSFV